MLCILNKTKVDWVENMIGRQFAPTLIREEMSLTVTRTCHVVGCNFLKFRNCRQLSNIMSQTRRFRARWRMSATVTPCLTSPEFAVMVNSCGSKIGLATAKALYSRGHVVVPYSLTGGTSHGVVSIGDDVYVKLMGIDEADDVFRLVRKEFGGNVVVVDYTLPQAVNGNASLYLEHGYPFVMGTTGGDRDKLYADVEAAGAYAVIAPQMGKQIVAFQAMLQYLAREYPGAFEGYTLSVVESHQATKVDTSGTAQDVVETIVKGFGVRPFDVQDIEKVREPAEQMSRLGVPESNLGGHAFHTYTLTSPDGCTLFEFKHNVVGRSIYAQGTVDAVEFLAEKAFHNVDCGKRIFNMVDVLASGKMT